jgi:hypothetical protein
VIYQSKRYNLAEIVKPPKGNFLLLETLSKDKNFARIAHVLLPDASKLVFKLGRGHDSDVKVSDISVSRVHAQITMTPKGFILEDVNSKFGTLYLMQGEPKEVELINGMTTQIGRTILTVNVRKAELCTAAGQVADAASNQFNEFPA